MPYTRGSTQTSGYQIVVTNFEDIEKIFYEVLYTETHWRKVVPIAAVEEDIDPGAEYASYRTRDITGQGSFRRAHGRDIPVVGQSIAKPTAIPILTGLVAAPIDEDEIRNYKFAYPGASLRAEAPSLLSLASDRHVESVIFFGDVNYGFEPWLNYPGVTAESTTAWSAKDPDEILFDINEIINGVWTDSKQRHLPSAIYLPGTQFSDIATRRMPDLRDTVLNYLKQKSLYSSITGGTPLKIVPIPYLEGAGAAGADRMVAQDERRENHKLPFPIPFRMRPPYPEMYGVTLLAEYRFGSYHIRYPASTRYLDGI